ncbi:discoidin domain-containing protein [Nocardioides ultimimeridianus]
MDFCANCGHELGVGRFCTNCGRPVAGRHPGTPAAPTTPAPTAPRPVVGTIPPPPRFPLYAEPAPAPAPSRRRSLLPWLVAALAVIVLATGVAAVALLRSGDDHAAVDTTRPGSGPSTAPGSTGSSGSPGSPTTTPAGTDLTSDISHLGVPGTAPASTDLAGRPVTFASSHLIDGDTQTAWRVAGDASGEAITITFDRPVTLTSVGLVNGYAKAYPGYDGYRLNRRITEVRWTFEDGTSVTQHLRQRRSMQSVPVSAGPTSSLRLEIVSTVAGPKRDWRDFTAISELSLRGSR